MALVNRDPFARQELHKRRVYSDTAVCSECGANFLTPTGRRYVYEYRTESDGGRVSVHRGLFCSKSCHDSYHT